MFALEVDGAEYRRLEVSSIYEKNERILSQPFLKRSISRGIAADC